MMQLIKIGSNVALYLPESFEWLILKSGLIENGSIAERKSIRGNAENGKHAADWQEEIGAGSLVKN